ncbi:MAG: hypothetical protein WC869_00305 [Phycisphaerae bacterium]|jgi:hypothetical protein
MATIPTTTSVAKWNRATRHVEATIRSGRYINAETVLVVAGPPRIADMAMDITTYANLQTAINSSADQPANGKDALYPVGLLEQVSINQVQTVQKIFEIGSRRSYQAGGRVQVVGSIGRVMFRGPSLMRALYAYYPSAVAVANGKAVIKNGAVASSGASGVVDSVAAAIAAPNTPSGVFPEIFFEAGSLTGADPEIAGAKPDAFYINLMSELFSHPFGLGFILRDNANRNYGALYLEDCFITAHSWQVGAASTLITETASLQADAAVPMEFSTGTVR